MLKVNAKNLETVTILALEGLIINGQTEKLREAVRSVADRRTVILDLARVTIVDAHGLGVLLEIREQTMSKGGRFKLMNVSFPMSKVLQITRLDSVFEITSGVEFFSAAPRDRRVLVAA
jgi:anti-anti-sigma factor